MTVERRDARAQIRQASLRLGMLGLELSNALLLIFDGATVSRRFAGFRFSPSLRHRVHAGPLGSHRASRSRCSRAASSAGENALFIAGRCVAHRPGPDCTTQHGAAVWPENDMWPKAWNAARTFSIEGEGEVLLVRYVPRDRAERAVAADPAMERAEELACWRDSVVGVDVQGGRVVGVRMTSR